MANAAVWFTQQPLDLLLACLPLSHRLKNKYFATCFLPSRVPDVIWIVLIIFTSMKLEFRTELNVVYRERISDAGKDWGQEEKGVTEAEMVGWHHWLSGHEHEQTPRDSGRQGSLDAAVQGVTERQTRLSKLNSSSTSDISFAGADPVASVLQPFMFPTL